VVSDFSADRQTEVCRTISRARYEELDRGNRIVAVSAGPFAGFGIAGGHYLRVEIAGRKVLVIGAARSGIASARFSRSAVRLSLLMIVKPLAEWPAAALELKTLGVGTSRATTVMAAGPDCLVVISPGVPTKAIRFVMRIAGAWK